MRIVGGRFKGTALAGLRGGDAAAHLRPTSDKTRESLFNLLMHGDYPPIDGARVLDLFAGTGALGFEALSRGAGFVRFVDKGAKAAALIRENAARLRAEDQIALTRSDATRLGTNAEAGYDLVFLDPPYRKMLGEAALAAAWQGGWIAERAAIFWEEAAEVTPPAWARARDARRYGGTKVYVFEARTTAQ